MYRSVNSIGRQSFSVIGGWVTSGLNAAKNTGWSALFYLGPMIPYTESRLLSEVQTKIHQTLIQKFSLNQEQTKAIDQSLTGLFGKHKSIIYAFIYKHIVQLYQQANQIDLETLYSIMLTSEGQSLLRDVLLSEQGINLIATIMSILYPQLAPNISSAEPVLKSILGHHAMKSIIIDLARSELVRSKMLSLIFDPQSNKGLLAQMLVSYPQFEQIVAKVMLENGQFNINGIELMNHILSNNGISFIATIMSIVYPQHVPNITRLLPFFSSILQQDAVQEIIKRLPSSPFVREKISECVLNPSLIDAAFAQKLLRHSECQDIVSLVMLEGGKLNDIGRQLMRYLLSDAVIEFIAESMSTLYPPKAINMGRSLLRQNAVRGTIIGLLNSAFGREKMLECIRCPGSINAAFGQAIICDLQFHAVVNEVMFKGEGGKLNDIGRQLMRYLLSEEAIACIADLDFKQMPKIHHALPFISATLQQAAVQRIIIGLPNSPFVREKMIECIRCPENINASLAQQLLLHPECQDIVRYVMLEGGKLNGIGRQLMRHLLSEEAIVFIDENKATLYSEPKSIIARALPVFIPLLQQPAMKRIIEDLPDSAFVRGRMYVLFHNQEVDTAALALDILRHPECQDIVRYVMLEGGKLNGIGRAMLDHILSQEVIAFIASYLQEIPNINGIRQFLDQPTIKSIIIGLLDSAYVRGKILDCVSEPDRIQALPVQDLLRQPDCQAIVGRIMLERTKGKLNLKGHELIAHLLSEASIVLMSNSISIVYPQDQALEMNRALSFLISVLGQPSVKSIIPGLANSAFVREKIYELIHNQEVDTAALALDILRHSECQDIVRYVMLEGGKLNGIGRAMMDHILSQEVIAFIASYLQEIPNIDGIRQFLDQPTIKSIIIGLLDSAYVREKIHALIHNQEVDKASLALELFRHPQCQTIVGAVMLEDGQFSDNSRALMDHILSEEGIALISNSMSTLSSQLEPEMIQFVTSVIQHPAMKKIILDLANYSKFREIIFEHVISPGEVFEKYKFAIEIIYDPQCQEIVRSVMAHSNGQNLMSSLILSDAGKQHIANFITNVLSMPYTVKELDDKIESILDIIKLADELARQTTKTSEYLSKLHKYILSVLESVLSENVQAEFISSEDSLGMKKRYKESSMDSPREVVFVHKLMNLIFDLSNTFKAIEALPLQRGAEFANLAIAGVFSQVLKIWDDANVLIKDFLEFSADLEDIIESQIFRDENLLETIESLIKQDDVLDKLYKTLAETTVVFPEINLGKWLGIFIQSFRQENKDNKLMLFISKLPQYLEGIATEFESKLRTLKEDQTLPAHLEKLNNAQEKLKRVAMDLKRISQKDVVFELNIMSLIYHGPQIWSLGKEIFESGQHVLLYSAEYTKEMLSKLKYNWFLEAIHFLDRCENNFFIKRGTLSTPVVTFVEGYYPKVIAYIAPYIDLKPDSKLSDFSDLAEVRFERSAIEYAINILWLERYKSCLEILARLIQTSEGNREPTNVVQLRKDLEELSPYMRRVDDLWYRNSYLELSKDKPNVENILVLSKLMNAYIHLHQEQKSSLRKKERFFIEFEKELIASKSQEDKVQGCAYKDFDAQVNQAKKVACLAPALELAIDTLWLERYKKASALPLHEKAAITELKIAQLQQGNFICEVSIKPKVQLKAKQIYDAQVLTNQADCSKRGDNEQRCYFNNSTLFFDCLKDTVAGAEKVLPQVYSTEVSDHMKSLEEDRSLSAFHLESKVVVNGLQYLSGLWTILQAYEPTHFQDSPHILSFEQITRNAGLFWNGYQLFLSYSALSIHELQLMLHQLSNSFQDLLPQPDVLNCLVEERNHVRVFWFLMAPKLVAYFAEPANNQLTIENTRNIADLSRVHGKKLDAILEHRRSYLLLWHFFDIKELVLQSQSNMSMLSTQLHALMISSTFKTNILEKFDQIVCTLGINPKLAQDLVQSMRGFFLEVLTYSMSSPKDLRKFYQDMSAFEVRVEKMRPRHEAILESISQCQSLIDIGDFTVQHKKQVYAVLGYKDDFSIAPEDALAQLTNLKSRLEFEARLIKQHSEELKQPQELSRHGHHLNVFDALCAEFSLARQSWFIDYQRQYQIAISQFFNTERQTLSLKCEQLTEAQFEPEVNEIFEKFDREHTRFHQKYKYLQTLLDIVKQIEDKLQDVSTDQDWFDDEDTLKRKQKGITELKKLFNIDDTEPLTDESLNMIHTHIMDFADFNEVMSEWCPVTFNAPHLGVVGDLLGWLWGCIYELARWFVSLCYEPAGQRGLEELQKASMRFFPPANEQISSLSIGLSASCV